VTSPTAPAHDVRRRRAIRHGLASGLGTRAISIVLTLAAVPVVTGSLGQSQYGAFALVAGLSALLPFSDLGLGSGLVTALGQATGRDDERESRSLVSAALFGLVAVSAALLVVFLALSYWVDWAVVLGLGNQPFAPQVDSATEVFGVLFIVAMPFGLGTRILQGLQRTHVANYWQVLTAPLVLVGYVLVRAWDGGLTAFTAVAGGVPLVVGAACTTAVLAKNAGLRPHRRALELVAARQLLRLSWLFLVLTLAVAVAFETDSLVISWVLGPDAVAVYSVTFRLFALVTLVAGLAFAPLWPAFAEALSRGDQAWAKRTLRRSVAWGAALSVPAVAALAVVAGPFISWWVGDQFVPPASLTVALAVWVCLVASQMPMVMLLNGAGVVRFQVVAATCMAVANVVLSILLARAVGVSGPVWGSVLAHTLCSGVPTLLYLRYRFTWRVHALRS
jgi:O-antigen/teichoic acid export membrane protein